MQSSPLEAGAAALVRRFLSRRIRFILHAFAQSVALLAPLPGHARCDATLQCCSTLPPGGDPDAGGACASDDPAQLPGTAPGIGVGNPMDVISGNKYERETDLPRLPQLLALEGAPVSVTSPTWARARGTAVKGLAVTSGPLWLQTVGEGSRASDERWRFFSEELTGHQGRTGGLACCRSSGARDNDRATARAATAPTGNAAARAAARRTERDRQREVRVGEQARRACRGCLHRDDRWAEAASTTATHARGTPLLESKTPD